MRFSVIVPVYGVEKYLDECVSSILSQTYNDFELILVDDKSPDNCPAMCDGYAKKDSRVRVIHKMANEGPGAARNTAIEDAQGEYILFVDADDTVDDSLFASCEQALEDNPDILAFGARFCYENKKGKTVRIEELKPENITAESFQQKADVFATLARNRIFQYPWNKAYKRAFLQESGVRFEDMRVMEDFFFNIQLFEQAKSICTMDCTPYFYRKPAHETLASKYNPQFFELAKRKYKEEMTFAEKFDAEQKHFNLIREGHIKHCVAAIMKNASKSAALSPKEQKQQAREIVEDALTVEAVQRYVPTDFKFKIIRYLLLKKKINSLRWICRLLAKR